jgi:riboflavin kinase/FMN adenylyltransferase
LTVEDRFTAVPPGRAVADAIRPRPPEPTRPFRVWRDGDLLPSELLGAVAAIGNFDGVHRGHKRLIETARSEAAALGRPGAVLTFEPHPRTYFTPRKPYFRLTPEPEKLAILKRLGLDGVLVRRFDGALAGQTAAEFVGGGLKGLGLSGVVVGPDFQFGRRREGDAARLVELCREHGLSCTVAPVLARDGARVSSSAIRAALEEGDVAEANDLLGHRWFVHGPVRHGEKRGRTLGYPTANMRLPDEAELRHGIYAVRGTANGGTHDGVASFGRRPTFDNGAPLLETNLFDFAGDLYGRTLAVEFVAFLRGEERFESAEALVARMDRDAAEARAALARDAVPSMIG